MKNRITKLAAAAVIVLAVLIGIHQFGGAIDPARVAWAEVAEIVEQIQTCTFQVHTSVTVTGGGPMVEKMQQQMGQNAQETEMKGYYSSKYGSRVDSYVKGKLFIIQYMLPTEKAVISVMPQQKKYIRMLLTDEHLMKMRQQGQNPRELVRQFTSAKYTELGPDTINGIEVEGIETTDPKVFGGMSENCVGRLWVDVKTNRPVRLEMTTQMGFGQSGSMQISLVMDQFQWDIELEQSLFELNIPADYTLMAETKMPTGDEKSAIQGLRTFAEIADGKYPSDMSVMTVIKEVTAKVTKEVTEVVMKEGFDRKVAQGDPDSQPSQEAPDKFSQELLEKMTSVQGACMFHAELVNKDKDIAYYGDKVTASDADAVLMRWKISDNQYRVIFGDLRVENVSRERLAELESQ